MPSPSSPQGRLDYAAPSTGAAGDAVIDASTGETRIDLGPMSGLTFAATVAPWALLAGGALGFIGLFAPGWRGWYALRAWIVFGVVLESSASYLYVVSRHRTAHRVLVAGPGGLQYSDATTWGDVCDVPAERRQRIRVVRPWWQPWVVLLIAEPDARFLSMRVRTSEPIVLARGTRRAELEQAAVLLRRALMLPE